MNRQRLLDIADEAIRADLLAPLGLFPPYLPIADGANRGLRFWEAGNTEYGPGRHKRPPLAIHISPELDDLTAVGTLAHELVHAALPFVPGYPGNTEDGHGPTFARNVYAIGLVGDPRATQVGPQFVDWFNKRIKPALA